MTNDKTFSTTRKNSFNLDKLKNKINKSNGGGKGDGDNRFWKHSVDATECGESTIRLLPGIIETDDDLPYVETLTHIFKGPGGTFWEKCRNQIGEPCPICASNSELYKLNTKESKALAGKRKKQHKYISNILVIDDKLAPQNNGKVFLFEYGPDLFKQFVGKLDGDEEDPNFIKVIPYMIDETGADFKIVTHKDGDYRKYSKSFYKRPSVCNISDELLAGQYSLKEFVDPSKVKSAEELVKRFDKVLKKTSTTAPSSDETLEADETPSLSAEEEETLEQLGSPSEESALDVDDEVRKLLG